MNRINLLLMLIIIVNIISCSSSIEETREEEEINNTEETYIFDEVPHSEIDEEISNKELYYLIQIGAFTTKQNAEIFANESQMKLGKGILVSYNSDVNLFVVRLENRFSSKPEAEAERDKLQKIEEFKDAWILTSFP